jgi:hypothetical protein
MAESGVSVEDFKRLERKVDEVHNQLTTIIRLEERQTGHGKRIGDIETQLGVLGTKIEAVDQGLRQWVNRGLGVWAAAIGVFTLVQLFYKR